MSSIYETDSALSKPVTRVSQGTIIKQTDLKATGNPNYGLLFHVDMTDGTHMALRCPQKWADSCRDMKEMDLYFIWEPTSNRDVKFTTEMREKALKDIGFRSNADIHDLAKKPRPAPKTEIRAFQEFLFQPV